MPDKGPQMNLGRKELPRIGSEDTFSIKLQNYVIDIVPRNSKHLTIFFDHANLAEMAPAESRKAWGFDFLQSQTDHSGLFVKPRRSDWYRNDDLIEFFEAVQRSGYFSEFERTMTYGGSMGGYAAIAFSGFCDADTVLSLNPQATLDKRVVPWEKRFALGAAQDWTGRLSLASDECVDKTNFFIVYDHMLRADKRHVKLLKLKNRTDINLPYVGHKIPYHMAKMGYLTELYIDVANEAVDKGHWQRKLKKRRTLDAYYEQLSKIVSNRRSPKSSFQSVVDRYRQSYLEKHLTDTPS